MAGLIDMFRRIEAAEDYARDIRAEFKLTLARLDRRHAYRSHLSDVLSAHPNSRLGPTPLISGTA
jgi:hypothetical protein